MLLHIRDTFSDTEFNGHHEAAKSKSVGYQTSLSGRRLLFPANSLEIDKQLVSLGGDVGTAFAVAVAKFVVDEVTAEHILKK